MLCAPSLGGLRFFGTAHSEVGGRKTREPGRRSREKETERETRRGRKERRNIMLAESGGDLKRKVAKTEKTRKGEGAQEEKKNGKSEARTEGRKRKEAEEGKGEEGEAAEGEEGNHKEKRRKRRNK